MAQFKPQRRAATAPKVGGSDSGIGTLLAYMISQQKGQGLEQELGPGTVATGGRNPATGAVYETQAGQDMAVKEALRKKAAQDAFDLKKTLPAIAQLKQSYVDAYQNVRGPKSGMPGGMTASREYGVGVLMRQNEPLRRYIDLVGQYEAPLIKAAGDSGNFSGSERESARKGLPKATPNMDIQRLFMPDDPEFGLSKLEEIERLYNAKFQEAIQVSQTGELTPGYAEWAKANQAYTGSSQIQAQKPDARSQKLVSIKERYKQRNP